jgi:hypothetical protein
MTMNCRRLSQTDAATLLEGPFFATVRQLRQSLIGLATVAPHTDPAQTTGRVQLNVVQLIVCRAAAVG